MKDNLIGLICLIAGIVLILIGATSCTTTYEVSKIDWDTGTITWEKR